MLFRSGFPVTIVGVTGDYGKYLTIGKLYLDYVITLQKATLDTTPRTAYQGVGNISSAVAPTGKMVSPYFAENSGSGMFISLQNTTVTPVFGISAQGPGGAINTGNLPNCFGDAYFDWSTVSQAGSGSNNAISGVIAKQTVDLFYTVCLDGLTGGGLMWGFTNEYGASSTLSAYKQTYAKVNATSAALIACGTVHIVAGERVSLTVTGSSGTLIPANCKLYLTPCCWGIDQ